MTQLKDEQLNVIHDKKNKLITPVTCCIIWSLLKRDEHPNHTA